LKLFKGGAQFSANFHRKFADTHDLQVEKRY